MDSLDAHTDYGSTPLDEADAGDDPMSLFARWFAAAEKAGLYEPNAMVVGTIDPDGVPSGRTVLLKGFGGLDQLGGPPYFDFVTNYESRKGRALAANPGITLLFPWYVMQRQVIVTGLARPAPTEVSDRYFDARPLESRLGSMASDQSREIGSRDDLERRVESLRTLHPDASSVSRPQRWGAFRVEPSRIEFWQGRTSRLHDRLEFAALADGAWARRRLQP